jgi:hypothetical protein
VGNNGAENTMRFLTTAALSCFLSGSAFLGGCIAWDRYHHIETVPVAVWDPVSDHVLLGNMTRQDGVSTGFTFEDAVPKEQHPDFDHITWKGVIFDKETFLNRWTHPADGGMPSVPGEENT